MSGPRGALRRSQHARGPSEASLGHRHAGHGLILATPFWMGSEVGHSSIVPLLVEIPPLRAFAGCRLHASIQAVVRSGGADPNASCRRDSRRRLRVSSVALRSVSSRSQRAMSSLTFATIRCCSARGGSGIARFSSCFLLTLGNAAPLPVDMMSSRAFQIKIRMNSSSNEEEIAATPLPIHARNAAMFVRPVVEPRTQISKSPFSQNFVGAVVNWFTHVRPNGPDVNSTGPLMSGTPSPDLL